MGSGGGSAGDRPLGIVSRGLHALPGHPRLTKQAPLLTTADDDGVVRLRSLATGGEGWATSVGRVIGS